MFEAAMTGRLGGDLELRTSKSGKPFATASVCCRLRPPSRAS